MREQDQLVFHLVTGFSSVNIMSPVHFTNDINWLLFPVRQSTLSCLYQSFSLPVPCVPATSFPIISLAERVGSPIGNLLISILLPLLQQVPRDN